MSSYYIRVKSCETAPNAEVEYWSQQTVSATQKNLYYNLGNVGIGVPNPLAKLQVDGSVGIGTAYATTTPPLDGLIISGNVGIGTAVPTSALHVNGTIMADAVTSSGGGIGYATGAGGAVTQITSRTTGVTLSKLTGTITLFSVIAAADSTVSFVLTNTQIAATDHVIVSHVSGGTMGAYNATATPAAGSATIYLRNVTPAATAAEAPVLKFTVIKSVVA